MTDVMENEEVEVEEDAFEQTQLRTIYKTLNGKINEIDAVLDVDDATAGKRKIGNELVANFESDWKPVAETLSTQMNSWDDADKLAGAYLGLIRALEKAFDKAVSAHVQAKVDSQPKSEAVTVTDEQKAALSEQRKTMYGQIKQVVDLAVSVGECAREVDDEGNEGEVVGWELPKIRRGGSGPRGKRALTLYSWAVDGETVADDNNTVKGVAVNVLGYERAADFTAALREAKIDTKEPPATFTVSLKGKNVTGTRKSAEEVASTPESDDDDEDDDSEDSE